MRSCEEFELLANLAVDEEATLEELAELNAHLETCPDCRAYFEDIKHIHGVFAHEEITAPEGLARRVMDRVRETEQERPAEKKKVIPFPHWRRWAALAACCAVAVLSVWAFRGTGNFKDATVTMDSAPRAADTRASTEKSAAQEPAVFSLDESAAVEDAEPAAEPGEAPRPMPEEYEELAKSAAKDGAAEGDYQPLTGGQSDQEPALAAAAPPEHADHSRESLPASNEPDQYPADTTAEMEDDLSLEDNTEPKPTEPAGETDEIQNPELSAPDPVEEPLLPDAPETDPGVEPVEVVNVPEPGILTVFGSAAQEWVENILGLEWAVGGSYPLSAEQYGDLLQTLDTAGEPYLIQPGEGYCLMTE